MRRHGWQLPYHPLQIVAVSVFFALVFAFYVFFIPFVGSKILEIVVVVLYSPTVMVVFALYLRCVAVNPADDGVLWGRKCNSPSCSKSRATSSVVSSAVGGKELDVLSGHLTLEVGGAERKGQQDGSSFHCSHFLWITRNCRSEEVSKVPTNDVEMLYCSLCKAEISMDSKHCRVCDKCIDGFDHHCRWLNNCVGRKNYNDFVALMVSGISMLILQWAVGLWVLVHCFLRFHHFQGLITEKLGSSFSYVAYIIVVSVCTLLAMAATYPLAQLFSFHVLLIKKGITTYDYIVAMRDQDQKVLGNAVQSSAASPLSSVGTATSGPSAAGALQGKAWCTPPRFILDDEYGIYSPERSLSVKDASTGVIAGVESERKRPVKLNPWALASLNKDDVVRAVTAAKKQSSILRPVVSPKERGMVQDGNDGVSSTRDISREFIPPPATKSHVGRVAEAGGLFNKASGFMERGGKLSVIPLDGSGSDSGDVIELSRRVRKVLNPLQMEAMNAFKSSHAFSTNGTTVSTSGSSKESSEPRDSPPPSQAEVVHPPLVGQTDWRYSMQGSESMCESDGGDVSYPGTPIRQVVYGVGSL